VTKIERRVDSAFARVACTPVANVAGSLHVLVLQPLAGQIMARPPLDTPAPANKGGKP
jgi:rod shape-determining protein MreC